MIELNTDMKLLFIGDSITDCGRRQDADGLGNGYVRLIRDYLCANNPAESPVVVNRGVGGNKVTDLAERWETDVLAEKPDCLSVKIGINDVWHGLSDPSRAVPLEVFVQTYTDLLEKVKSVLSGCKIVLCEPSVISPPAPDGGNIALKPYVQAVGDLAKRFEAEALVPLHGAFLEAQETRPDIVWTTDGVHPTSAGHMLIALTWLRETGLL